MSIGAEVYNNESLAGYLEKTDDGIYIFRYEDKYFQDAMAPAISLSFPKSQSIYISKQMFPFFVGLLSEGANKHVQCRLLKVDENDFFSLLLKTAFADTIGAITIKAIES